MFLMWAQQWRYICRAMELGYRVLRADTDVYLAEDPYPLLRGPLFSQFQMVRLAPPPRAFSESALCALPAVARPPDRYPRFGSCRVA